MVFRGVFVAFVLAGAGACASTQSYDPGAQVVLANDGTGQTVERMPDGSVQDTIGGSRDNVLQALNGAYTALGLSVDMYNPQSGAVGTQNAKFFHRFADKPLGRFFECGMISGGMDRVDRWYVYAAVVSQVITKSPGQSAVNTRVTAYAQDPSGGAERVPCESAGRLETLIMQAAREKMTKGS